MDMQHGKLLQQLVEQLKPIRGLRAIVLGGSYARGDQRPDSDLDLGLYYTADQPLDTAQVRSPANSLPSRSSQRIFWHASITSWVCPAQTAQNC